MVVMVMITPVVIVVILMVPVAFMKLPAFLIMVVMGMGPICAFVRRALPVSCNPAIVVTLGYPVSLDPNKACTGRRATTLIAQRRRRGSDVNRNLTECWNCQSQG